MAKKKKTRINRKASDEHGEVSLLPTGATMLDLVLGGGVAEGRVFNVVGDKSTGKTLLAIELAANFNNKYPQSRVVYCETEAAFDVKYAATLGLPVDAVEFPEEVFTVEDFYESVVATIDSLGDEPCLYVLDSLDALSDAAERDRGMEEGSYGANKAKKMSELFRRITQRLQNSRVTLVVVSQERDNIGVVFGSNKTRSGGRALDFYASQVLWLNNMGRKDRTIKGVKRVYALDVRAKCEKNKVGMPFRHCRLRLVFGYGVCELSSCLMFLIEVQRTDEVGLSLDAAKKMLTSVHKLSDAEYKEEAENVVPASIEVWHEIEHAHAPTRKKYDG